MTALLAVERGRPDDPVRITPAALHYSGSGSAGFRAASVCASRRS